VIKRVSKDGFRDNYSGFNLSSNMSSTESSNSGDTIMEENLNQSSPSNHFFREQLHHRSQGEICCLVSGADIDTIQGWLKCADSLTIKTELFSRDKLQQTPLSLALKRGDPHIVSLLLSVGEQNLGTKI
jgi:hypothetical protein